MMTAAILILGGLIFLSGSALIAFTWAAKTGQFRDLKNASAVIFDEEEPIGVPTDRFPAKNAQ